MPRSPSLTRAASNPVVSILPSFVVTAVAESISLGDLGTTTTTGSFTVEALRAHGPRYAFPDLAHPAAAAAILDAA